MQVNGHIGTLGRLASQSLQAYRRSGLALILQGSSCALSVPEKCRIGQVPTTISQISAYLPLPLRWPFLIRRLMPSKVRILDLLRSRNVL